MLSSAHYLRRSRPEDSHTHLLTCDGKKNKKQHSDEGKKRKEKKLLRVAAVPGNDINKMTSL